MTGAESSVPLLLHDSVEERWNGLEPNALMQLPCDESDAMEPAAGREELRPGAPLITAFPAWDGSGGVEPASVSGGTATPTLRRSPGPVGSEVEATMPLVLVTLFVARTLSVNEADTL